MHTKTGMLFGQHFDGGPPRNLNHVFLRQFQNSFIKKLACLCSKTKMTEPPFKLHVNCDLFFFSFPDDGMGTPCQNVEDPKSQKRFWGKRNRVSCKAESCRKDVKALRPFCEGRKNFGEWASCLPACLCEGCYLYLEPVSQLLCVSMRPARTVTSALVSPKADCNLFLLHDEQRVFFIFKEYSFHFSG